MRYPGIRVELGEVRLNIDRSRVVDSALEMLFTCQFLIVLFVTSRAGTTDEFNAFDDESVKSMGVIKIRFTGQQGCVTPTSSCLFVNVTQIRCGGVNRRLAVAVHV